ncbi:hypothetical protein KQX54_005493 [Cotesia glomerata]|uniref:Uncharacterized protein n=1 Tax=Cotesia glomerata TaxID=32391 RepID=A0AAV7I9B6_COTGL|nr:hypothetical protein KQX54_005493 [Cotesia glomerata]
MGFYSSSLLLSLQPTSKKWSSRVRMRKEPREQDEEKNRHIAIAVGYTYTYTAEWWEPGDYVTLRVNDPRRGWRRY